MGFRVGEGVGRGVGVGAGVRVGVRVEVRVGVGAGVSVGVGEGGEVTVAVGLGSGVGEGFSVVDEGGVEVGEVEQLETTNTSSATNRQSVRTDHRAEVTFVIVGRFPTDRVHVAGSATTRGGFGSSGNLLPASLEHTPSDQQENPNNDDA